MLKIMQNLVFLVEPPENEYDITLKAVNMCMNRFCIDEEAAFELVGVYDTKTSSQTFMDKIRWAFLGKGKVNYLPESQICKLFNCLQ